MYDLPHVASRLYGTPLLIARSKLEVILDVLGPRIMNGEALQAVTDGRRRSDSWSLTDAGIAVLPILGTLVRRSSWLDSKSGLTSYHDIENMAAEAFTSPDVRGVLLDIDSNGGEGCGVFDLVDSLRAMASGTDKPLWAVADEYALSSGYAVACAAERIFLPRTAMIGSVGVVAVHVDESEADRKAGLAYTYIYAGAHKIDANPHTPLTSGVLADLQASVDELYGQFVEMVAASRKLSPQSVRDTEARIYRARDALKINFADEIGTLQQAHDAMVSHLERHGRASARLVSAPSTIKELSMDPTITPEPAGIPADSPKTAATADQSGPEQAPAGQNLSETANAADAVAQARQAMLQQLAQLNDIASLAGRLGVDVDPIQTLAKGISPDALRGQVLKALAEQDKARTVLAVHPVTASAVPAHEGALLNAVKKLCAQGVDHGRC